MQTKEELKKQGKRNKQAGIRFELKVRKELESKGLIVAKWSNNINLEENKLIPCKHKFRGIGIPMAIGTGFPDFIVFTKPNDLGMSLITGIEVKGGNATNKYLSKEEKEKCKWLLENDIFANITIANRGDKQGEIKYIPFEIKEKKD